MTGVGDTHLAGTQVESKISFKAKAYFILISWHSRAKDPNPTSEGIQKIERKKRVFDFMQKFSPFVPMLWYIDIDCIDRQPCFKLVLVA